MNSGKIIRILDESTVIINLGARDGVGERTRFGIYTATEDIIDPESGEVLGPYRRRKAVVVTSEVHDSFSVARTPAVRKEVVREEPSFFRIGEGPKRRETVTSRPALDVRNDQIAPLPSDGEVAVGDLVEVISG